MKKKINLVIMICAMLLLALSAIFEGFFILPGSPYIFIVVSGTLAIIGGILLHISVSWTLIIYTSELINSNKLQKIVFYCFLGSVLALLVPGVLLWVIYAFFFDYNGNLLAASLILLGISVLVELSYGVYALIINKRQ